MPQHVERLGAVRSRNHAVAEAGQLVHGNPQNTLVVIDHQNLGAAARRGRNSRCNPPRSVDVVGDQAESDDSVRPVGELPQHDVGLEPAAVLAHEFPVGFVPAPRCGVLDRDIGPGGRGIQFGIEFRKAAARWMENVCDVSGIDPEKEVLHSIGSKAALSILPTCFINSRRLPMLNSSTSGAASRICFSRRRASTGCTARCRHSPSR